MDWSQLKRETIIHHARSSGAGGQHVNKVATQVILTFFPKDSLALSDSEKDHLFQKLKNRLSKEGALRVSVQESRSQFRNNRLAWAKLRKIVENAILPPKPKRKATAFKANRLKRLTDKKRNSEKKAIRGRIREY